MEFLETKKCCFFVDDLKIGGFVIAGLMLLSLVASIPGSPIYLLIIYGTYKFIYSPCESVELVEIKYCKSGMFTVFCAFAWCALIYGILKVSVKPIKFRHCWCFVVCERPARPDFFTLFWVFNRNKRILWYRQFLWHWWVYVCRG